MNILVVIPSDGYIRNYLTSSALSDLENKHNVSFLVSDSVKNLDSLDGKKFDLYDHDKKNHKKHFYMFDLLMWRYRKKSSTFKFRLTRTQGLNFRFPEDTPLPIKLLKIFWRLIRYFLLKIRNYALGSSYLFYPYFLFLKSNLNENSKIRQIIEKNSPDIIIFPCSAYDPDGNDIISISKKLKIKTFFLVDNWDNLSSKSIFWIKPDYLGVWGKQSLEHAVNIQGFSEEQIFLLGTPRFNNYFKYRDKALKSPYDFKYVLFVGTALAFDEPNALKFYEEIIEKNQHIFPGLKIVYRPHPWRQRSMFSSSRQIEPNNFKHIILDKQIEHAYQSNNTDDSFQPQLDYYPALISNAEFVTGGLTSMLIESVIFRKIFLGLIHDDKKHFTSMHRVFKGYKHFQGIESMEAVSLCSDLEKLESLFLRAWDSRNNIDPSLIDNQRQYYYYYNNQDYAQILDNACDEILGNHEEAELQTTLCIPTFNRKEIMYSTIQSLISSKVNSVTKILIIDDGSSDNTFETLQEFNSVKNIKILKNDSNIGYARNFLKCFNESDTKFVIMGTDDDVFFREGIEEIQSQLSTYNPDFISTKFISPTSSRAKSSRKEVSFNEIMSAAKHATGLVYKRSSITSIESELIDLLNKKNLAAFFYPQIILLTIMKVRKKLLIYSPTQVSGIHPTRNIETQLKDEDGGHYLSLSNLTKRHQAFIDFYEGLLKNPDYKEKFSNIKNLLVKQRLSLFDNLEAGIRVEGYEIYTDFRKGLLKKILSFFNPKKYYYYFLGRLKNSSEFNQN